MNTIKKSVLLFVFVVLFSSFSWPKILWKSAELIKSPSKIIVYRNNLWISDKEDCHIYCLDLQGRKIKKILRKGEGPGEIRSLIDFNIFEDRIYVNAKTELKSFDLNGEYKKNWNIFNFIFFYKFQVYKDGFIVLGDMKKNFPKYFKNHDEYDMLHDIDFSGQIKKSFMRSFEEMGKRDIGYNTLFWILAPFVLMNNEVYLINPITPEIWKINVPMRKSIRLLKDEIPSFVKMDSKNAKYQTVGQSSLYSSEDEYTSINIVHIDDHEMIVFFKTNDKSFLRFYELKNDKARLLCHKDLANEIYAVYAFYNNTFYGKDDDFNVLAFNLD